MALTYTPAGKLGSRLPEFSLPDVLGGTWSTKDLKPGPTIIMFICNHCPYVLAIEDRLLALGHEFREQANFVAICSNDSSDHPEDAPPALAERARNKSYPFPYLVDGNQQVARAFGAVCTPDLFIYDQAGALSYRGRLDDAWRAPQNVRSQDLRTALKELLANKTPSSPQIPSMGCSIKWKHA